jgi:hypothetical protein
LAVAVAAAAEETLGGEYLPLLRVCAAGAVPVGLGQRKGTRTKIKFRVFPGLESVRGEYPCGAHGSERAGPTRFPNCVNSLNAIEIFVNLLNVTK